MVIKEAGDLLGCLEYRHRVLGEPPADTVEVTMFVVQSTSPRRNEFTDGGLETYDDEAEARERAVEIAPWDHVDKVRVVRRTVTITEEVVADERSWPT